MIQGYPGYGGVYGGGYGGPQGRPSAGAHFVLVLGVFVLVAPYISQAVGYSMGGWVAWVGGLLIFFGVVLSIMREMYV